MAESTITSKGQTTVPADIRAFVYAKPGTRLVWSVMPDGTIIVMAKTKSILHMAGMLKAPKGKRVRPLWTFDKAAAKVIGAELIRTR